MTDTSTKMALIADILTNDRDSEECELALMALADLEEEAGKGREAEAIRSLALDPEKPMGFVLGRDVDDPNPLIVWGAVPAWRSCRERFPEGKTATGVELDSGGDMWFALAVTDCFDPPIAVVRADGFCAAEEAFVDGLDWAHISPDDLADFDEDGLSYGPSGQPYDSQSVAIWEVQVIGIVD